MSTTPMHGSPKEVMSTVVFPNSEYRRPASVMSSTSRTTAESSVKAIKRSPLGTVFLSFYVSIGMIFFLLSIVYFVWTCLGLAKFIVVSQSPQYQLVLSVLMMISLGISVWIPTILLFGNKSTFRKYQKTSNWMLLYGTIGVFTCGILNIIYDRMIKSTINAGTPVGSILFVFAGLTLKIFYDLKGDGEADEEAEEEDDVEDREKVRREIILPYKEKKRSHSISDPV